MYIIYIDNSVKLVRKGSVIYYIIFYVIVK